MMDPHTDIPHVARRSRRSRQPVAPIESRFMFVDVAALRAKQLRRGALVRVTTSHDPPHKLERVAMEEVRRGLVEYTAPEQARPRGRRPRLTCSGRFARRLPADRGRAGNPARVHLVGYRMTATREGIAMLATLFVVPGRRSPGGWRIGGSSAKVHRRPAPAAVRVIGWLLFLPLLLLKGVVGWSARSSPVLRSSAVVTAVVAATSRCRSFPLLAVAVSSGSS